MNSKVTLSADLQAVVARLRLRDGDSRYDEAPILDAYARISRSPDGEVEKTDRQLSDILASIVQRDARLGEVLRDDNKSAWNLKAKRKDWDRLVERLETGQSNGVVAWHTDRLMRQPRDLERLIDFGEKGLVVGSCHGNYSLDSADDRFVLRVLTAAAAKASDDLSRRQKRKAEAMRKAGFVNGGARAFGFPTSAKWVAAKPGRVAVPDEQVQAERDAVRWGVEAHIDGMSIRAIAREWNVRGLTTVNGTEFTADRTRLVLLRARNAGLIEHKGVIVGRIKERDPITGRMTRDVDPIISEDQLRQVRSMFTARKRGRPYANRYLLSGLLVCGACGKSMNGHHRETRRANSLYVQNRYRCICERTTIDAGLADAWVRSTVIQVLSGPKHARAVARTSAELAAAERRVADAERDGRGLAERLGDGRMSLDEYDAASEPLRKRLTGLRAERDALAASGTGREAVARNRTETAAEWDSLAASNDFEALRALVREAMPRGIRVSPATSRGRGSRADDRLSVIAT